MHGATIQFFALTFSRTKLNWHSNDTKIVRFCSCCRVTKIKTCLILIANNMQRLQPLRVANISACQDGP